MIPGARGHGNGREPIAAPLGDQEARPRSAAVAVAERGADANQHFLRPERLGHDQAHPALRELLGIPGGRPSR
jgi:hypothetical protein